MSGTSGTASSRSPSPQLSSIGSGDTGAKENTSSLSGSIRSISQTSDTLDFTVIRSWTLDRIDKSLAKIDFSMALKRFVPDGENQVQNTDENPSETIDIEADIQINGNSAHGVGTFAHRCLALTTEIISNNPLQNPSEEGVMEQQKVLNLLKKGLNVSCVGTAWLSFGTNTYLCLHKEVLDENGLEDTEASTHLVFNHGIYSPSQKSAQDRYSNILEQCINVRNTQDYKGKNAALTGLTRLYNEGIFEHKPVDPENLVGQWKLHMIGNDELENSVIFEWAKSENDTYSVTRNYKGVSGAEVSCQSPSYVDVAAVKTQTASSEPPDNKTIYNFLFWDGPDANSPLSLAEQKNIFHLAPPLIISNSDEYVLFISQDGRNTFLLESYEPDAKSDSDSASQTSDSDSAEVDF